MRVSLAVLIGVAVVGCILSAPPAHAGVFGKVVLGRRAAVANATVAAAAPAVKKAAPPPPPKWHKWFTLAVIIVLFLLMAFNWRTTETVAFMALVVLWDAGILSAADAMSGFSNSGMLTVGVLFVVVHGVDKSRLAPYLGRKIFGVQTGERWALLRMCMFAFALSAFLNNTPIVAMLTPIVRDWARTRGFHPSTFLIPLSYATAAGGMITLIGTSTNLVITGLVTQAGLVNVGFFDIALVALPAGLLSVAAMVWLAPIVLPKNDGLFRQIRATGSDIVTEVRVLPNFPYVGKAAGYAMASMGFNAEILIKIRRLNVTVAVAPDSGEFTSQGLAHNDIFPVDPSQVILVGDILFFSGSKSKMMEVLKGVNKGLEILGFEASKLEGTDLQFVEVLLSERNPFVGDVVMQTSFSAHYGVSVLALRRKGRTASEAWRPSMSSNAPLTVYPVSPLASCAVARGRPLPPPPFAYSKSQQRHHQHQHHPDSYRPRESQFEPGFIPLPSDGGGMTYYSARRSNDDGGSGSCSPPPINTALFTQPLQAELGEARELSAVDLEVGRSRLGVGDALLLLARGEFIEKYEKHADFLLVQTIEKKLPPVRPWDYFPLVVFVAMVLVVAIPETNIDMLVAAMSAAAFLIFGGWVDAKEAVGLVEWDLLLLIGSMLSLSKAMTNSGLADAIAGLVSGSNISPLGVLFVLYIVTCFLTEVLSNNGCAGLCFPIAVSVSKALRVSYMPFVIAVMFGSTTSFLTPIGYQCNLMVYSIGGYKFTDFTKMGIPLNVIYTLVVCLLSPVIWPFGDERYIIPAK